MEQIKPVLVLGANGKTGSRVVERLESLNIKTRKGSRNLHPKFDWTNEATWPEAVAGTSAIYITYQPDLAAVGAENAISNLVELAKKSAVEKLVLLSGRGEIEAQRCEEIVKNSGLSWTIVRASWFNQNFSESYLLEPILAGFVALPAGDVKEPFVDADDIADVVVAALTQNGHDGKLYEVTGPRLLSFKEAIGEIAQAIGKDLPYVQLSIDEYVTQLATYGVPKDIIGLLSYLFTEVLDGRNQSIANGVEQALGRKPKDFLTYINETKTRGIWEAHT